MEGLQAGLESMKIEFHRVQNIEKDIVVMLDQFNLLMANGSRKKRGRGSRVRKINLWISLLRRRSQILEGRIGT